MEYQFNINRLAQLRSVVSLISDMFDNITFETINSAIPFEIMKNAEHVIITGCGDSYCASIAAKPVFRGVKVEALRNIEVARYYNTFRDWDSEKLSKTIVCAISKSGGPVRPLEALLRFKEKGATVIAITNYPESPFGQAADYCINMNIPVYASGPQVDSFTASTCTAMMFALTLSCSNGSITKEQAEQERQEILDYVKSYSDELICSIDSQALQTIKKWLDEKVDQYDYIGDGQEYATAFLGSAKLVEASGEPTTIDDSEDWNHINFFNAKPKTTGTLMVINESSPSFSRLMETVRTVTVLGRPLLVVTDSDAEFPDTASVFRLPKPKNSWWGVLMQHLPLSFIATYSSELLHRVPFRKDTVHQNEDPNVQTDPRIYGRFRNSKVELIL